MIDKFIPQNAYELAKSGLNNKQIIESLPISKSTFYANMDILDSVKKARIELRKEVSEALLNNVHEGDTTSLIFLAKRLNLFSEDITIDLKSPKSALQSLEEIANANINNEHRNSLRAIIGDYFKAYELVELEQRIALLEGKIDE